MFSLDKDKQYEEQLELKLAWPGLYENAIGIKLVWVHPSNSNSYFSPDFEVCYLGRLGFLYWEP